MITTTLINLSIGTQPLPEIRFNYLTNKRLLNLLITIEYEIIKKPVKATFLFLSRSMDGDDEFVNPGFFIPYHEWSIKSPQIKELF